MYNMYFMFNKLPCHGKFLKVCIGTSIILGIQINNNTLYFVLIIYNKINIVNINLTTVL